MSKIYTRCRLRVFVRHTRYHRLKPIESTRCHWRYPCKPYNEAAMSGCRCTRWLLKVLKASMCLYKWWQLMSNRLGPGALLSWWCGDDESWTFPPFSRMEETSNIYQHLPTRHWCTRTPVYWVYCITDNTACMTRLRYHYILIMMKWDEQKSSQAALTRTKNLPCRIHIHYYST